MAIQQPGIISEDSQGERSAQLLSQANLHRMRQEWDEAVTCSMQVLYNDPNNWRAHALLGDIYADQKRPDEAIRWYCMTLDIRPDSHSTRDKLNNLVTSRRQEFVESLDPTRPLVDRTGKFYRDSMIGKLSWQWSAPERRKPLYAALGIAIVILVAVAIPVLSGHPSDSNRTVFEQGKSPTASTFFLVPADQNTSASTSGSTSQTSSSQTSSTASTDPSHRGDQSNAESSASALHDSNESALISQLSSSPDIANANVHVVDAEIDPPTNTLSVTFTCDASGGAVTPDQILRDGLVVGKTALAQSQASSAQTCVVRCLTLSSTQSANTAGVAPDSQPSATASPTLTFVGTLPRTATTSMTSLDKISDFQISQTYSNIWWAQAPQASQPQPAPSAPQPSPTPSVSQ